MRKDAGLNGDLDRLPQLSWILFLKCYDDLEMRREEDAKLERKAYKPVIPSPYRWRDWASDEDNGRRARTWSSSSMTGCCLHCAG
jgi:type I restriction enzyme M protein